MTSTTRTASIALTGDAAQLVAALERLAAGGFVVDELTVGKVSVRLRGVGAERSERDDRPAPTGIYQELGGEILTQIAAEVVPGVELQPAIGRRAG
jgi:hypothetical protein